MREAIYAVPQMPQVQLRPSTLLFRLPATLPVVKPLQGRSQTPIVVDPPRIISAKAEIVSRVVSKGIIQGISIEGLSKLLRFIAPAIAVNPPVSSLRGIIQTVPILSPSNLLEITPADIISQIILQGELVDIPSMPASQLLKFIAPSLSAAPPVFSLRGIKRDVAELLAVAEPSNIITVPFAEIISSIIIQGELQPLPADIISKLLQIFAQPQVANLPLYNLKGLLQEVALIEPSALIVVPTAEIISQVITKGLVQVPSAVTLSQLNNLLAAATPPPIVTAQRQNRRHWRRSTSG